MAVNNLTNTLDKHNYDIYGNVLGIFDQKCLVICLS